MRSTKLTESSSTTAVCSQPHSLIRQTAMRLALFVCLTFVCSGCSLTKGLRDYIAYNDSCNDFVMGWRNNVWSRQAWHEQKGYFADHPELRAFGQGFRDGYRDVAGGGSGCPPPVPPRKYWTWKYQTAEGQCKVAAWFEGYSHGARAAEEHGAGYFQDIQVSYAIETQYSPEFQRGDYPNLHEGMPIMPEGSVEPLPIEQLPDSHPQHTPTEFRGADATIPEGFIDPVPIEQLPDSRPPQQIPATHPRRGPIIRESSMGPPPVDQLSDSGSPQQTPAEFRRGEPVIRESLFGPPPVDQLPDSLPPKQAPAVFRRGEPVIRESLFGPPPVDRLPDSQIPQQTPAIFRRGEPLIPEKSVEPIPVDQLPDSRPPEQTPVVAPAAWSPLVPATAWPRRLPSAEYPVPR